jgi:hypothetical protein
MGGCTDAGIKKTAAAAVKQRNRGGVQRRKTG